MGRGGEDNQFSGDTDGLDGEITGKERWVAEDEMEWWVRWGWRESMPVR